MVTMSIAATRMYRSLSDFLSSNVSQKSLPKSGQTALETNGTPVFLTDIQVAVHKAHEQPSAPRANRFGTDFTERPHVKLHELTVDVTGDHDIECGSEDCVV